MFKDEQFPAGIGILTKNLKSKFVEGLIKKLNMSESSTLSDLDSKIKWMSCQVRKFTYYLNPLIHL